MIRTKARACDGKKAHPTRKSALAHLARLVAAGASPDRLNIYPCPTGADHLNIGHVHPGKR